MPEVSDPKADLKPKAHRLTDEQSIARLKDFGMGLRNQIETNEPPAFNVPTRTKSNIYFNERDLMLELGKKKSSRRFMNVAHLRKFMQSTVVAAACQEYMKQSRTVAKRELYYNLKWTLPGTHENVFEDDTESGQVLDDLECSLDILREQLHVNAKGRGSIYGDIDLKQLGDEFSCKGLGRGGWLIPGNVEDVEVLNCNADYILAIENDAMFSRLIEEKAWKRLGCLLVTGEGMFPRGVRRFIKILQEKKNLPVIVFNDGDPWGWYIYSVLKYGSIELAHLSNRYAVPKSKFVGMTMDDIDTYGLQKVTEKLKDIDRKKIREEMEYPWFKHSPEWMKQLKLMSEKGVRLEQQALASKSLQFVAEKYLPEKIEKQDFLP